ncbi:MAG: cache and HAMP domain-containing protein, partial [Anaerolineales bacterium]
MSIDLWGLEGGYHLDLPLREIGYLFFTLSIASLIPLVLASLRDGDPKPGTQSRRQWLLTLILVLVVPLTSGALWIRLPEAWSSFAPGFFPEQTGLTIVLLAALPWMLAGGLLGTWQAILVGLVAGLVQAGWQTGSLLTPALVALEAGFVAWLMRRRYSDWLGKAIRHPALSGLIGGLALGLFRGFEIFAYRGGNLYEGLDHSLSLLSPTILVSVIEAVLAGLLCEGVRHFLPKVWYRPERLVVGPYRRSLTARLVTVFAILGLTASGLLLYGDWLLARNSAKEMLERQLAQTASQAAEGIPFFIQTGRSLVREVADGLSLQLSTEDLSLERPASQMLSFPFFATLAAFDSQGELLATASFEPAFEGADFLALEDAIALTLAGVPQEFVLPTTEEGKPARMAFLSPVLDPEGGEYLGVAAGLTDLMTNPMLLPVTQHLAQVTPGKAFVVDAEGRVLIHHDPGQWGEQYDLENVDTDRITPTTAPDGAQQFSYARQVPGYSWYVIVTVPQQEVNTLAVRLAARLFVLLAGVGGALMFSVYLTSRRLTKPLSHMATVAESIARGDLAPPVEAQGEDE